MIAPNLAIAALITKMVPKHPRVDVNTRAITNQVSMFSPALTMTAAYKQKTLPVDPYVAAHTPEVESNLTGHGRRMATMAATLKTP